MELAKYFAMEDDNRIYIEKSFKGTQEEYLKALEDSKTIYVSNIDENIKEERLWMLFSMVGEVKRVIMGINRGLLTFCGFCFVEFERKEDADNAIIFFKDFCLDGKFLKVDKDMGFAENRQYGRGVFGGTVRSDNKRRRYS
ncbi:uncharacterized protein VICG_01277 [Vittaforma corneae ATCC 50505]|uniref:Nuclear cap-binding protein subunit 2 n=1 Tax=Vittaforma corneae (strain ATCC 50505) TaxID=993615 RepID=L2GM01_VITCO|nr:uncharacterized protein VICG_01277 [Vittaforma corneae ATCC 50505]ELA41644.1 hypothetical protein VICG_01277 [Vittaforma corneae ATCC 50505]